MPHNAPPRPVVLVVALVLGSALYAWGSIAASTDRDRIIADTDQKATTAQRASKLAVAQSEHDHAFLYAVCKRFHRDEIISMNSTSALNAIERKYPHPNPNPQDRAYHDARLKVLAQTEELRQSVNKLDCLKAMQKALVTAPTLEPSPAPTSPT